ncbi:hypothetical protein ACFZBU_38655 [Embleya sp. NPDC008237]|uniref:hypothetical protein n=1 Tax=Embleya sp. NPDC008237 TaxID=3363978 RepID=UPI0036EA8D22
MTDATDTVPGTDPDRAGFTVVLSAARDQLVLAAGVIADTVIDLVGTIGRQVLAQLLPERRVRTKDRIVKRAISKYNARGPPSTGPPTRPPSASTCSQPNLDTTQPRLNRTVLGLDPRCSALAP